VVGFSLFAVENVACAPVPDAMLGERIGASVILRNGHAPQYERAPMMAVEFAASSAESGS
jgi:hypothetical protein